MSVTAPWASRGCTARKVHSVCVCVCVCACTRAGELLPGAEGMDTLFGRLPLLKDQLITLRQPYCLFLLTMFNKHRLFNLI